MLNEIKNINKIYIACPAKYATGGTELLHQLFYKLKNNNVNVKILYTGDTEGDPTAERFKKYQVEYVFDVEDQKDSLLIVAETYTQLLNKYKNIKKCVWWLSVDNYIMSRDKLKFKFSSLKKIIFKEKYLQKPEFNFKDKDVLHLCQSHYSIDYLKSKGIEKMYYLSDYLNDVFLKKQVDYTSKNRNNIVLYNPDKGIEFTKKIMEKFSEFKYIPLQKMTPDEIVETCMKSKVYIDFGKHPGKDRFPREAAILGCCIITGKKGSAKYYDDVKINEVYKFNDDLKEIEKIGNKIKEIFDNYDEKIKDFEEYRVMIKNEEKKFEEDIKKIFI